MLMRSRSAIRDPRYLSALLLVLLFARLAAAQPATVTEADYVIRDFRFASGEVLPELRLHYRTVGTPQRDANGRVRNAVIVMHGTGGTGAQFVGPWLCGRAVRAGPAPRRREVFRRHAGRDRPRQVEQAE